MRLSEIPLLQGEYLKKDSEFEAMNYCTSGTARPFLSFIEKEKFLGRLSTYASSIICRAGLEQKLPGYVEGVIVSEQPKYTFHRIYNWYCKKSIRKEFESLIGSGGRISGQAFIAKKNVSIGRNVVIEPFAVVNENVEIGNHCIIRSNAVLGGVSFSFARSDKGEMENLRNNGRVILEDHVEVMCNTHIAQGIWEDDVTVIGRNSKIDAQCHIGHGARIGQSVLVAAGSVIGGNADIGDNSWIGINATVSNRIKVGKNARVNLGAVVTKDVEDFGSVSGNFAVEHLKFIDFVKNTMAGGNEK